MAGVDLGSIVAHLKLEMSDFNSNLNKAQDQLKQTSNDFRGMEAVGKTLTSAGTALTAGVTAPVVAFGASTVKTQAQFQEAMAKVQALSGASGKELELLTNTAKKMGSTTKYSATECADALGYMALAGWDANQSADALPGVLNLAAASGMDLASASDLVTDYLSAFGMEANQAGQMADILAYAQANTNTSTEQLGEAFKNCAVNAKGFGQDLPQTTALLGALANQGLKGSEAGTALNAVFRDMTQKMKDGCIQIGNTKVAVTDANGNFRDMTDIIADVNKATDGMSESEKQAALMSTFTADSIKAMGILCNTGAEEIDGLDQALRNSNGTAENTANIMNNTLNGAITELKSAFEGLQLGIGDTTGPLTTLVQWLTQAVRWFDSLSPAVKQTVVIFAALAAAVGPVLLILGKLMTSITSIKAGITMLSTAFSFVGGIISSAFSTVITAVYVFITDSLIPAISSLWAFLLANPIVLVVAAIAALVAAFIYCWNNVEGFKEFWINAWNSIKEWCSNAVNTIWTTLQTWGNNITTFFTSTLPNAWNAMIDWFRELPGKIGEFLSNVISKVATWVTDMATKAKDAGTKFFNHVCDAISQLPEKIAYWLAFVITKIVVWIAQLVTNAVKAGTQFVTNVVNKIQELPGKIQTFLTNVITRVTTWATNMATKAKTAATNFFNNVVNTIQNLPSRIQTFLTNIINNVITWASNMATKAREAGTNFLNNVVTFIQQLPGRIATFLSQIINRVISWASQMATQARTAASQFLNNVVTTISQVPGRVWSFLSQTLGRVTSFVSQMGSKARQAGQQFASNIKGALTNLPGQMVSIGKNIIQGLINGITSMAGAIKEKMSSIAKSALDGAKAALGIKSPSKAFRDEVGKWIPEGIAVGIDASADDAINSVKALGSSLTGAVDLTGLQESVNIPTFGTNINSDNTLQSLLQDLKTTLQENNTDDQPTTINLTLNIDKFNNQRSQDVRGLMTEMTDVIKGTTMVKNGVRK